MNYLDIGILGFTVVWTYRSYKKGFIQEVSSILGIILGLYGGFKLYEQLGEQLKIWLGGVEGGIEGGIENIIGFVMIFIAIHIGVNWIGRYMQEVLIKIYLGWVNSILGIVLGLSKSFLILGIILWILNYLDIKGIRNILEASELRGYVVKAFGNGLELIIDNIPADLKDTGKEFSKKLYQLNNGLELKRWESEVASRNAKVF